MYRSNDSITPWQNNIITMPADLTKYRLSNWIWVPDDKILFIIRNMNVWRYVQA